MNKLPENTIHYHYFFALLGAYSSAIVIYFYYYAKFVYEGDAGAIGFYMMAYMLFPFFLLPYATAPFSIKLFARMAKSKHNTVKIEETNLLFLENPEYPFQKHMKNIGYSVLAMIIPFILVMLDIYVFNIFFEINKDNIPLIILGVAVSQLLVVTALVTRQYLIFSYNTTELNFVDFVRLLPIMTLILVIIVSMVLFTSGYHDYIVGMGIVMIPLIWLYLLIIGMITPIFRFFRR